MKSTYEMAALITSHCIRFVDECNVQVIIEEHIKERFMDIYKHAVSMEVS